MKLSKTKNYQQEQIDINYLELNRKLINDRSVQQLIHYLNQTENIFTHFILRQKFLNEKISDENELKIMSIRCMF